MKSNFVMRSARIALVCLSAVIGGTGRASGDTVPIPTQVTSGASEQGSLKSILAVRRGTRTTFQMQLRYLDSRNRWQPNPGRNIEFYVDNQYIGSSRTDRNGLARIQCLIPKNASVGIHHWGAVFRGAPPHLPASGSWPFQVTR